MVMGGDSCSEGCGFKSQHQILGGYFYMENGIYVCLKKAENKRKRGPFYNKITEAYHF